ncbi:MAG: hypothetical protein ABIJ96_07160 [Elusimicrobiota bacterium]
MGANCPEIGTFAQYRPSPEEVDALIARAKAHPLGLDYLLEGEADSISATFGVHAFVIDSARDLLTAR